VASNLTGKKLSPAILAMKATDKVLANGDFKFNKILYNLQDVSKDLGNVKEIDMLE
jgi:hypothetical protein